jgi:hypothetical protein
MLGFAEQKIADPLAAIAQYHERSGIDKISEQDAVAGFDLGPDRVGGVPGILADRKGVAAVGRELHLRRLG